MTPISITVPETIPAGSTLTLSFAAPAPPSPPPAKPRGYQTFYVVSDSNSAQLQSKQVYCRYDWNQIESAPGRFDFAAIDADYNAAVAAGKQFNFRIKPFEDGNAGPWGIQSLGGKDVKFGGVSTWQPNLDAPAVQADLDKLLAALGARYAAHAATIDIGWFGPYGEWSNYNMANPPPLPSLATWNWLIAEHKRYFPQSIVVTQAVVDYEWGTTGYLNTAMSQGCWQRIDAWGLADPWDMQAARTVLTTMQTSPYFKNICMIGEPFDTNQWSASDWQTAVTFAKAARMAMWSSKGNAIPTAAMPYVNQLLSMEASL